MLFELWLLQIQPIGDDEGLMAQLIASIAPYPNATPSRGPEIITIASSCRPITSGPLRTFHYVAEYAPWELYGNSFINENGIHYRERASLWVVRKNIRTNCHSLTNSCRRNSNWHYEDKLGSDQSHLFHCMVVFLSALKFVELPRMSGQRFSQVFHFLWCKYVLGVFYR